MKSFWGFVDIIDDILYVNNGSITSWIRSKKHNKEVGGVENSMHIYGLAIDAVFDSEDDMNKAKVDFERRGLFVLDEGDHLHIQIKR